MTLDEWRREHDLTVSCLADKLGVRGKNPQRTVQRYLTAERIPDRAMMRCISELTGGSVTDLDFPIKAVSRVMAAA